MNEHFLYLHVYRDKNYKSGGRLVRPQAQDKRIQRALKKETDPARRAALLAEKEALPLVPSTYLSDHIPYCGHVFIKDTGYSVWFCPLEVATEKTEFAKRATLDFYGEFTKWTKWGPGLKNPAQPFPGHFWCELGFKDEKPVVRFHLDTRLVEEIDFSTRHHVASTCQQHGLPFWTWYHPSYTRALKREVCHAG